MKKIFSILTVLLCVVLLSTTAFAADAKELAIYEKYIKNSTKVSSMDISMVQKIAISAGGEDIEVTKQNIAAKILITPDNKLEMGMRMVDSATLEISNSYFRHNYLYQQVGGEKYKIKMDMDSALAGALGSAADLDPDLTDDMLKDAKIEQVDGGIKVSYKTGLAGTDEAISSMLEQMNLPDNIKMSLTDMSVSMVIDEDGTLKSYSSVYSMNLSDDDVNLKFKVSQFVRVNSINSVDLIVFPADLSTYQLIQY